jgi:hypothetical protein
MFAIIHRYSNQLTPLKFKLQHYGNNRGGIKGKVLISLVSQSPYKIYAETIVITVYK